MVFPEHLLCYWTFYTLADEKGKKLCQKKARSIARQAYIFGNPAVDRLTAPDGPFSAIL